MTSVFPPSYDLVKEKKMKMYLIDIVITVKIIFNYEDFCLFFFTSTRIDSNTYTNTNQMSNHLWIKIIPQPYLYGFHMRYIRIMLN